MKEVEESGWVSQHQDTYKDTEFLNLNEILMTEKEDGKAHDTKEVFDKDVAFITCSICSLDSRQRAKKKFEAHCRIPIPF